MEAILVANEMSQEQMIFCKAERLTLVFNSLSGSSTKGLKKEDLEPIGVLHRMLFNRSKYYQCVLIHPHCYYYLK